MGNASSIFSAVMQFQFPHGVEYGGSIIAVLGANTTELSTALQANGGNKGYSRYTVDNVTIAGTVDGIGFENQFQYNIPNGTCSAWLLNAYNTGYIYPCILKVVNAQSESILL